MIRKLRMLWSIVRRCNAEKITIGFLICFFLVSLIIMFVEPSINTYNDALWYTFISCTTIGYGDVVVTTTIGRLLTVFITVYEIVLVAMLSGVIVNHYLQVVNAAEKLTATQFLDKLEHLTELDKEELTELEERVKKFRIDKKI